MTIINDNGVDREMTEIELETFQKTRLELQRDVENNQKTVADKNVALASARAKLAALGLTEAEIKALVG